MDPGIFNDTYTYLTQLFEQEYLQDENKEPQSLRSKRAEAFQIFSRKGFPSIKQEDWRFTNLNRVLGPTFRVNKEEPFTLEIQPPDSIKDLNSCRIVLINGRLSPKDSDPLPEGIVFLSNSDVIFNESYLSKVGSIANDPENAMLALNLAFFDNVHLIHIQSKKPLEKPVHLVHYFTESIEPRFMAYRLLVLADELSEGTLIETFHSETQSPVFVSYVSEFSLANSAVLHTHLADATTGNFNLVHHREIEQFNNSVFNNSNLSLGDASFIRNDLNCRLLASGTETNLWGAYVLNGQQHVDNHSIVDHQMPNCNSNELYKGIMMDRSHGVFNGKIYVRLDAQKTNAFQRNNNILMSDQASINSKPQLEIFADDVKCSHGSTVGQFDEDALFYLRTRGIGEEAAKRMLIQAFVEEVLSKINIPTLREYLFQLLQSKLQAGSNLAVLNPVTNGN